MMSGSLRVSTGVLAAAILAGAGTGAAEKLNVWAVPGAYRIFPVSGECIDVAADKLAAVKAANSIWDAKGSSVTLTGARREVVGFQLILEPAGESVAGVTVAASDLTGPGGKIGSGNVRLFLAGYVPEGGKFYPDILVPFEAGGVHPISIPHRVEKLAAVPGQRNQTVWVDVAVPAEAAAGRYAGTIDLRIGDAPARKIKLSLEVLDLAIPLARSVHIVLDQYSQVVKLPDLKGDELIETEKQFYRLAHDHRQFVNVIRYPQRGDARQGRLPDCSRDKDGKLVIDWGWWDRRFGAYLDGSAFADGQPIEQFCLYFNMYWPANAWPTKAQIRPGDNSPEKLKYEQAWAEHARAFIKHFKRKGWDKVKFTIKMNHYKSRRRQYVPFNTDVPRSREDFQAVGYFAGLVHRTFKEMPPLTMRFRMDTGHSFCKQAGCTWTTWEDAKAWELMRETDLWFFHWRHGLSHRQKIKQLKAMGKECYVYYHGWEPTNRCPIFKGLGWILWAAELDGYNAYNNPHADLKARRPGRRWNNYVMYVGWNAKGRPDAFASVRLKLQRESLYDYEYLKQARAKDPKRVAALAGRMVKFEKRPPDPRGSVLTGPVPNADPAAYARARKELISILK